MSSKELIIPNIYLKELGNRINKLIEDKGINQKILAGAVGLSEPSISAIVKGKQEPGASKILGISNYFGISPNWLLAGDIKKEKDEYIPRKPGRRGEDQELLEFRDKIIDCFVDISNSHSHIWEEVIKIKNN